MKKTILTVGFVLAIILVFQSCQEEMLLQDTSPISDTSLGFDEPTKPKLRSFFDFNYHTLQEFSRETQPKPSNDTGGESSAEFNYFEGIRETKKEKEFQPNLPEFGQDWMYDKDFWSKPNLTFPSQILPSYQDFHNGFPKNEDGTWMYGADAIYGLVGGDILQTRLDYPIETGNTCVLKVSIALNESGIHIPCIQGQTIAGANGKCYFLNARMLSDWMRLTFRNAENWDYAATNVHSEINGRTGIVVSNYPNGDYISGHSDIYLGKTCSISPNGNNCSFRGMVYFWELN